jgi:hypothetical protein
MELLDVQPRKEEELVDGEAEQQEATKEEQQGWMRQSCSLQGMDEVELQPAGDGRGGAIACRGWPRRSCRASWMEEKQGMAAVEQQRSQLKPK